MSAKDPARPPAEFADTTGDETGAFRDEQLRSLGAMLVGIAHELNTPLGVVLSTCDGLRRCRQKLRELADKPSLDPDDQERLRGIIDHMESGAPVLEAGLQRLDTLIRVLRLQGRSGEGFETVPVDLIELLESNLLLLHHDTKQGITVERRFAVRPSVPGNAVFLGQAFLNLMRNAVQAMQGTGTLVLEVRERAGQAEVEVRDTGPGIPEEVLGKLFRCDVTTKCPEEGTGIGLLNTWRIIAKHGGTIVATNGPDGGAVFTVTLPLS